MPKISKNIREQVRKRALGYCEYCLSPSGFSPDTFQIDHIIPLSIQANSHPNNLAFACGGCNGHKYNKTQDVDPLTNQLSPLFNPRNHNWHKHFQWNEDETIILGTTNIGRATVEALDLNRQTNINLRKLLLLAGLHPPERYPGT